MTFFSNRLSDSPCEKEAILGLTALVNNYQLPQSFAKEICTTIFQQLTVQSLVQSARKNIFNIFTIMLSKYHEEIIEMKKTFVSGFTQAMDGEKDPRNLMSCFWLVRFIGNRFPSSCFDKEILEELFAVTSCYFPITFSPPKDDPYGITGDDLKKELAESLSIPQFSKIADGVFNFLVDKLEDTIGMSSKLELMKLISACFTSFGVSSVQRFLPDFWILLKKEVISSTDKELVKGTLKTIGTITRCLCPDNIGKFAIDFSLIEESDRQKFLGPLTKECLRAIKEPDTKIARVYGQILITAASVSARALRLILSVTWSSINEKFNNKDVEIRQKQALLELISDIINNIHVLSSENMNEHFSLELHPLKSYIADLIEVYSSTFRSESGRSRAIAVSGYSKLTIMPIHEKNHSKNASLVPSQQVKSLVKTLSTMLFLDKDPDVQKRCLSSLVEISHHPFHNQYIIDITLPKMFAIPEFSPQNMNKSKSQVDTNVTDLERQNFKTVLDSIIRISASKCLFKETLPKLLAIVQTRFAGALSNDKVDLMIIKGVLASISEIVKMHAQVDSQNAASDVTPDALAPCIQSLPSLLLRTLIQCSILSDPSGSNQQHLDNNIIDACGNILHLVMRVADTKDQSTLLKKMIQLYINCDTSTVGIVSIPNQPPFQPFIPNTNKSQHQLIYLFTAVISAHRKEVMLPDLDNVVKTLLNFILSHNIQTSSFISLDPLTNSIDPIIASIKCLAAIVNKLPKGKFLTTLITEIIENQFVQASTAQDKTRHSHRLNATKALVWTTKAMVMRKDIGTFRSSIKKTTKLEVFLGGIICQLLCDSNNEIATLAAAGFGCIMEDCKDALNRQTHANIGVLYRQRFLMQNLPRLVPLYSSSSSTKETKEVILMALSNMLRHAPQAVLLANLKTTIPLLIQSLSSPEPSLKISSLFTLTKSISDSVSIVEQHISSLIPALIKLTRYRSSMKIRLLSLKCLEVVCILSYSKLHPFKKDVMNGLGSSLDDVKRIVRRQAVRTRNEWYCLDAPSD